ncbi:MAG: hypothetical protein IJT65_03885 [Eubacterium sp.]|nr:hypothetical protein [Eubacterium sp.]
MSKFYSQPEYKFHKYIIAQDVFTTSDLDDDDEYTKPAGGNGGTNSVVDDNSFAG